MDSTNPLDQTKSKSDDVPLTETTAAVSYSHDPESNVEAAGPPKTIKQRLRKWFGFLFTPHFWIIFIHGQILSWCIVSTNTLTSFLANGGNNIPAFQTLFNYVLLCLIFTPYTIYKYGFVKWCKLLFRDGWKYFLFAFADVEGNYFVVKAYAYTNMLSAALLDNFAIVVVVILSFVFLKVRYKWTQLIGIVTCIGGMALLVVSDVLTDKDYPAMDMVKGDLFMLLGAGLYGVSNTLEEFFVSKRPLYEVVGQLGFWGMFINGVQCAIFERDSLRNAQWSSKVGGYFAGYTLSMLLLYCTAPILFRMASAAFYNLSLLTSDFWSLLVGIEVFGYYVYWLYPVGFVFTVLGMIVYYLSFTDPQGEARKPWLGKNQELGVAGVGTAKGHAHESDPSEGVLSQDEPSPAQDEIDYGTINKNSNLNPNGHF
uniref:ARAD1D04576p n=1 Tax=Blastobotrys adeninivorans TaxID=409370 RepID=A0A060T7N9_BLAAD